MKVKKILLAAGSAAIVLVIVTFALLSVAMFDVMSGFASGSETLAPAGNVTGKALVVYNPGISGTARDAAGKIANDLGLQGYSVVLAGIKSQAAADTAGYDVIAVGGPVYAGNASSSVKAYLQDLHPGPGARVGVFGCGGYAPQGDDFQSILNDVASLPADSPLDVRVAMKVATGEDVDKKCEGFVTGLLQ